jgi:hypothetical protein
LRYELKGVPSLFFFFAETATTKVLLLLLLQGGKDTTGRPPWSGRAEGLRDRQDRRPQQETVHD